MRDASQPPVPVPLADAATSPRPSRQLASRRREHGVRIARISLTDCRIARPRRPLPEDLARWVRTLSPPAPLIAAGLAPSLRTALLRYWRAFEARLARGIQLRIASGERAVVFAGALVYRIRAGGAPIATGVRDGSGRCRNRDLEVLRPFADGDWVGQVLEAERGLLKDIRRELGDRRRTGAIGARAATGLAHQARDWLLAMTARMAHRTWDRRALRARLRAALAIDPELAALARRMRPHAAARSDGTAGWLACVAAQRAAALEMGRVAPALLPLFGMWLSSLALLDREPPAQPLAGLRRFLRDAGAQPADWRLLLTDRARPVWRLVRAGRIRGLADIAGFLADWARLHRGLPPGLRLPSALWEPLCQTGVEGERGLVQPPVRWPFGPDVTAEAIRRWRAAARAGQGADFVAGHFGLLVRWAADYGEAGRPRLNSWRNAVARARAHDRGRRAAAATAGVAPWKFPRLPALDGPFVAVPLTTPLDLVEEAFALHHCADTRVTDCDTGCTRLYGIRRRDDGARVATLQIDWEGGPRYRPQLVEVRGLLNRPVPEPVRAFAQRVVASLGPWCPLLDRRF
jgi:hypothetical protein